MRADLIKAVLGGQAGLDDCKEAMSEALRGIMVKALADQMQLEVAMPCGRYYRPEPGAVHRRAGSALGQFWLNGTEERFARPRVRQKRGQEVKLKSYAAARKAEPVQAAILRAVASGVSSRDMQQLHPAGGRGFSASEVSRHWVSGSLRYLAMLRDRDLQAEPVAVLMLDGIVLSEAVVVIVALGVLRDGRKRMLDFEVGSTESYEVSRALLE
ncbi:MAG: transposase, partial [Kiritimatiellia bacterium]